jgi:hypothetical protein
LKSKPRDGEGDDRAGSAYQNGDEVPF